MKRHLIKHPVACDSDLKIWNDMQIICWPTLLVLNPDGIIIGEFQGETQVNLVNRFIGVCHKYYQDSLNNSEIPLPKLSTLDLNSNSLDLKQLKFPTKILINGNSLYISDSGNNRVLIIDILTRRVLDSIGSGDCGWMDSDFANAKFDCPQGLAFDAESNVLYIADTFNDVIRAADLNSKQVTTICGICNKGKDFSKN